MKFGQQQFDFPRPVVPSHDSNLVQKMLICLGFCGVVCIYMVDKNAINGIKALTPVTAHEAPKTPNPTATIVVEKAPEAKPVVQNSEKYLEFDSEVEPGWAADFKIKNLPIGAKYTINFGDGTPVQVVNGLSATHVFKRSGRFFVTLTAEFNGQKQTMAPYTIEVHEKVEIDDLANDIEM